MLNGLKLGNTDIVLVQSKTLFRLGEVRSVEEATALFYHPSFVISNYKDIMYTEYSTYNSTVLLGVELQCRRKMV